MYINVDTFFFIVAVIIWIYAIGKISNVFKLNYRLYIFIMVFSVICLGLSYRHFHFLKINSIPENGEDYRIKEVFLDYSFNEYGSADVGHKLLFKANKKSRSNKKSMLQFFVELILDTKFEAENKKSYPKNSLAYVFYEMDKISSLEVLLNGNSISPSDFNIPNTYELKTDADKNILTVYLPHDDLKNMDLSINYSVKNALGEDNGVLVYYNTFFPERTNFSFNTNTRGKITFHYPDSSIIKAGANSKDFWVNIGDSNRASFVVDFKNKLPYEKHPFGGGHTLIYMEELSYDDADFYKNYNKNFSLITRLDFLPAPFKFRRAPDPISTEFSDQGYSVSELKSLNKENNEKFSDFKFVFGFFHKILESGDHLVVTYIISLYLFIL